MTMKLGSTLGSLVFRPASLLIALSLSVLLLAALSIPLWISKVHNIQNEANETIHHVHQGLLSTIQDSAVLLSNLNRSAANLRSIIKSSSATKHTRISFSDIESEVAPKLFDAMSIIPHVSQISYITSNGLYFSFYLNVNQSLFAAYSNTSIPLFLNHTANYIFYTQPVYQDSGEMYGNAMNISVASLNIIRCFKEAMISENAVQSILGSGFDDYQDPILVNTVTVDEDSVLTIGFEMSPLVEFLTAGLSAFSGSLNLMLEDGTMLSSGIKNILVVPSEKGGSYRLLSSVGDLISEISCQGSEIIEVENTKLVFYCSKLDFVGLQTVYVVAVPYKGLNTLVKQNVNSASKYFFITIAAVVLAILVLSFTIVGGVLRERRLSVALVKQMEATRQAERKSMNKSAALSSASHDIRTSLTGILGLLEITRAEVDPRSEITTNLMQAQTCANDLLGILNSILDASKIEAGKMLLEEQEFDLERLLEDMVDLFHPVAMKKGVDVILEPYNFSFGKYNRVKGDSMKLKQILSNLLSNAVKFTYDGHITLKVFAQKPIFRNAILTPKRNKKSVKLTTCFIGTSKGSYSDNEVNNIHYDDDIMEFIFEVNDTGKGIPKEKQQSVFENYIQVKDMVPGHEGTGLGLGIVQSLVRLMGGEIGIVDKETCEKGTCFRFNTFLSVCGNATTTLDIESHSGQSVADVRSPKPESSHAVLFLSSNARSKMLQTHLESQGVKVYVVDHYEQLRHTLKTLQANLIIWNDKSKLDLGSRSSKSTSSEESVQQTLTRRKTKPSTRGTVLIVIDTSAGLFRETSIALAEFRRDLTHAASVKVAWIDRPGAHSLTGLDSDKLASTDVIFSKPLHGSRLNQLIGLLSESEGTILSPKSKHESLPPLDESRHHSGENVCGDTKNENRLSKPLTGKKIVIAKDTKNENGLSKPLTGKKILIAEDNAVLRKLATAVVTRLGAEIFTCENGEKAVELVRERTKDLKEQGMDGILPFDYILMDCEMPIMNGRDASRQIREEEKQWNLHIPIIALTAHDTDEERNKMTEAGMDYCLSKPLKADSLLNAVLHFNQK